MADSNALKDPAPGMDEDLRTAVRVLAEHMARSRGHSRDDMIAKLTEPGLLSGIAITPRAILADMSWKMKEYGGSADNPFNVDRFDALIRDAGALSNASLAANQSTSHSVVTEDVPTQASSPAQASSLSPLTSEVSLPSSALPTQEHEFDENRQRVTNTRAVFDPVVPISAFSTVSQRPAGRNHDALRQTIPLPVRSRRKPYGCGQSVVPDDSQDGRESRDTADACSNDEANNSEGEFVYNSSDEPFLSDDLGSDGHAASHKAVDWTGAKDSIAERGTTVSDRGKKRKSTAGEKKPTRRLNRGGKPFQATHFTLSGRSTSSKEHLVAVLVDSLADEYVLGNAFQDTLIGIRHIAAGGNVPAAHIRLEQTITLTYLLQCLDFGVEASQQAVFCRLIQSIRLALYVQGHHNGNKDEAWKEVSGDWWMPGRSKGDRRARFRVEVEHGRNLCNITRAGTLHAIVLLSTSEKMWGSFMGPVPLDADVCYSLGVAIRRGGATTRQLAEAHKVARSWDLAEVYLLAGIYRAREVVRDALEIQNLGCVPHLPKVINAMDTASTNELDIRPPYPVADEIDWVSFCKTYSLPPPVAPPKGVHSEKAIEIMLPHSLQDFKNVEAGCYVSETSAEYTFEVRKLVGASKPSLAQFVGQPPPIEAATDDDESTGEAERTSHRNKRQKLGVSTDCPEDSEPSGVGNDEANVEGQQERNPWAKKIEEVHASGASGLDKKIAIVGILTDFISQRLSTADKKTTPSKLKRFILKCSGKPFMIFDSYWETLTIYAKGPKKTPLVLYCTDGPLECINRVHRVLANLCASKYKHTKSRIQGYFFRALHCTAYYRFARKVNEAMLKQRAMHDISGLHEDEEVSTFDGIGKGNTTSSAEKVYTVDDIIGAKSGKFVSYSMCKVRMSGEALENYPVFLALQNALRPVFDWIAARLAECLPDTFNSLRLLAKVLPQRQDGFANPFCGFVLNVNCITGAHRDVMDSNVCACFALGDWEGGHFIIDELGLVFPMKPGEIIIFNSGLLTHLNMHYKGLRMSVVAQSDKYLQYAEGLAEHFTKLGLATRSSNPT